MNTVIILVAPICFSFLSLFFFFWGGSGGEWVGCVGDGVKAVGHGQTKGHTAAA